MTSVLVIGDAIVDVVFAGLDRYPDRGEEVVAPGYDLRAGGSAGYSSLGLAALGTPTDIVANVGDDVLSTHWLSFLDEWGVDTSGVFQQSDTRISVAAGFLFETDRSFVTHRGASESGTLPPVTAADEHDALFVTGFSQAPYLWSEDIVAVAREFAADDRPVFLDTNWSPGGWHETFFEMLSFVDTLLVNDEEARRLAGCDDLATAGSTLVADGASACAIKAGERGCLLVEDDAEWVGTDPVTAVDDCGAGDFFNAGFVRAMLDGGDRRAAADSGNRCARAAITRFDLREKLDALAGVSG
ncbi:carbohydrate kinase family protein [Haloplanus natans]|uniref:carbohydrate kinase family protein n=1 Tax=Haloplanus natans TaxID=376171 RepID=UPI000677C844|nr:carbohydrate kinase family protein [Haloplanus natans]